MKVCLLFQLYEIGTINSHNPRNYLRSLHITYGFNFNNGETVIKVLEIYNYIIKSNQLETQVNLV